MKKLMRRCQRALAFMLAFALVMSSFLQGGTTVVMAATELAFVAGSGYEEGVFAKWSAVDGASSYKAYVSSNGGAFTEINSAMIRKSGEYYRVDAVGLAAGTAQIKVEALSGSSVVAASTTASYKVTNYDRSGYAHFNNTEGVGAYNDDGTLKSNAIVLYVTDSNKNSVSVTSKDGTTVTGIGHILNSTGRDVGGGKNSKGGKANNNAGIIKKLAQDGTPLVVRIIGDVKAPDGLTAYDSIDYGGTVGDNGYMARISDGLNVTIEGIGSDAVINGWGIHFIANTTGFGKNFEMRNISFKNVPEDCVGMEGQQDGTTLTVPVERCWVHDCAFYAPKIANPAESDKDGGDGACDFKRGQYFTNSYCYYEGYHKTNLVGSSNTSLQYHLTYHHNYWKNCESRGPLARQANIHMYNNIFEGQTSYCMNPRANAYIFSEYNMFINCKNPVTVDSGAVKSYKDTFTSCTGDNDATKVSDRSTKVNTSCKYANFDTNSSLSYIPSGDYVIQEDLTEVKKVLSAYAGTLAENPVSSEDVSTSVILKDRIPSEAVVLPYSKDLNKSYVTTTSTTVDNIIFNVAKLDSGNLTVGGNSTGQDIVFRVNTAVNITMGVASGTYEPVLCNESGVGLLTGSGTVTNVPAGVYYIQSGGWDPGSSAFKEAKITSLKIEAYDSSATPETEYTVTVQNDGHGTASAAPTKAIKGTTVTLTATPNSGYEFDSWQVVSGGASVSNNKFVMPASNVVVKALFKESAGSGSGSGSGTGGGTGSGSGSGSGTGYIHNFTESGKTSDYYSITGNLSTTKGSTTYNGLRLTQCLKMETSTNISFTSDTAGELVLVFDSGATGRVKVDGTTYNASNGVVTTELNAGSHTIIKGDSINLFYMEFIPEGSSSGGGSGEVPVIAVTGVTLDQTTLTLTSVGQTAALNATVAPVDAANKNVTWASSNPSVATVNNGVVTAVANGNATITVTTEDGSKTATCAVNVVIASGGDVITVPVTSVSLDKTSASFTQVGESVTLKATVAPNDATNKQVIWTSSNSAVAVVDGNGVVTAVSNGDAAITVTTADGGYKAVCNVNVTIESGSGSGSGGNTGGSGEVAGDITVTENKGYQEGAYVEWTAVSGAKGYKAYVAKSGGSFTAIDNDLIRKYPNYWRVDAVGLSAGTYDIKIEAVMDNGSVYTTVSGIKVIAHERNGFAWVNGTASGAYNEDGTLKSNAKVVYITEKNKSAMMDEIEAYADGNYPLCLRLIGNITDASNLDKGDLLVDGCDTAPGLTIEGIGEDATANGWGIRIKNSSNVEVRNIGLMNCNSTEGDSVGLQQENDHIWIHNCDFFYGDAGSDADQAKGDGALDTKKSQYVTHSYNHFWDTGKTHLNGNGDTTLNYITYHHNWYDHSDSRHPLVRVSSAVHVYNNLYDGVSKYGMIARLGCSIFAESNYFKDTKSPILISQQGTDMAAGDPIASDAGGMIKSYGNVYDNTKMPITHNDSATNFDCYEASSKSEKVPSSYKTVKGGNVYSNFDTGANFYSYSAQAASDAKTTVENYAGRVNGGDFKWDFSDPSEDSNYDVNTALKSALTGYSSSLVSVGGMDGASSGGSGGSTSTAVTGVTLNKSSETLTAAGQTVTLVATVAPSTAANKSVTWTSSSPSVATVTNGVVKAVSNGTTVITVKTSEGNYTATCVVAVNISSVTVPATGISIDNTSLTLTKAGQISVLTATVAPANASNKSVTWTSSNSAVATVSDAGIVTAVANGTATITAKSVDGGYTATCAVTVDIAAGSGDVPTGGYVHNFTEDGTTAGFYTFGTTANLSTTKGTVSYKGLTLTQCLKMESSTVVSFTAETEGTLVLVFNAANSPNIKVDDTKYTLTNGILTLDVSAGTHKITKADTSNLFYMEFVPAVVEPENVSVTGIALDKTNVSLTEEGQVVILTATVAPSNATNKNVTWTSSNSAVATVNNTGAVIAVASGTTTITATTEDGNFKATCEVTVTLPVKVTGVTVDRTDIELTQVGETRTITATITPSDAANKKVTWTSSDESVATVNVWGVVSAVGNGTAVITATTEDGGFKATSHVVVKIPVPVTGVTLDKTTLTFTEIGQTDVLIAKVAPSDAANKNVTWTSSNTNAVTVSSDGVVVAVANGTATITATTEDGEFSATCNVKVAVPVKVTGVTLDKSELTLTTAGQTATLVATVTPNEADDKEVSWTSSNTSVATVSNGVVKAVGNGTTTITVTTEDGGFTATCDVTVDIPVNVTGVALDKNELTLTKKGQAAALVATVKPANADNQKVTWTSSDDSVATVSNAGVVVAVGNGTTTITVTTEEGNYKATCQVTVAIPVAVSGVTLDKDNATLTAAGQTVTLVSTVLPADAANKSVTWTSSNTSVATVSNGVVTAVANGTTTITVTTKEGGYEDTCLITVNIPNNVTGVTLNKTSYTLKSKGEILALEATITPSNADNHNVTWESSNESVATVSNAGVVVAVANGTTTITVTTEDGGHKATCEVTVAIPVPVTGVELNKTELAFANAGDTATLEATVKPADAANKNVIWESSNDAVATVNNGVVTAVANGTATITVTTEDGGHKATCEVTVTIEAAGDGNINVTAVTLDKTKATLTAIGEEIELVATVSPSNATNSNVTWESSNESVATVTDGVVRAVADGTATITVTTVDGSKKATCEITVKVPVPVTDVTLDKSSYTLRKAGETFALTATVNPSNADNRNVTWTSSNGSVATVSNSGVVTAVGNGTADITVTTEDGSKTAVCVVTVNIAVPVTAVTLNKTSLTLTTTGQTESLTATVAPSNASNKNVTWTSSKESVATVSNNGVVSAVGNGTATITVTTADGSKIATCVVTVAIPVPVTGVEITKSEVTLTAAGQTETLTANVLPANASNKKVAWSTSDGSVAVVSTNGVVTAVGNGTATITATTEDGNKTATCEVKVAIPVSVAGVRLDKTSIRFVNVGQTATITATVAPSNAANKNVTWKSSDVSVATVSNNGVVTAVGNGTATITVTTEDGNKTATCEITVAIPVSVTGVTLNKTSETLVKSGQTLALEANVLPATAGNKNVTWSTSNGSVAVVSSSGVVTAIGNGTATITVTTEDGNKTATCEITVAIPVSVTGVNLDKGSVTLNSAGQTTALTATVAPSNAANKKVTWSTSSSSVATVSESGVVTAVGNGTAVITATTEDGSYNAMCVVTVAIPVSVTGVGLDKEVLTFTEIGQSATLTAAVTPAGAANSTVYWTTSNASVAVVSNSGVVTAVGNGTAVITVTTEDGNKTATCDVKVEIPVKATGLILDKTSATLTAIGATCEVTATVLPSNASNTQVRWISTDETVAIVNKGVITAVGNGTAVIVATSVDGGFTANCKVTVNTPVSVTGVSLNTTSATLSKAGEKVTLTATVSPSNAANKKVTWSSSNEAVATVANGVVTAVANGTATITVTTADGSYKATCEITVNIPVVTDPVQAFVERMYTVALGRDADAAGVANWVAALRVNTHDGANIAEEFILGAEFAMRNLNDEQYVDTLYHTFFNRDADEGGKELWLAVLASGQSRGYVLSNFVNLPEFTMLCESYGIERGVMLNDGSAVNPGIPQFVKRMYTIVLGREAENDGLYNNVIALVVGAETPETVAKNFFTSQEYLMKNKDNAAYVSDLYRAFMNREADQSGLEFWVSCIEVGMTRDEILTEFAKSNEFKMIAASYGL